MNAKEAIEIIQAWEAGKKLEFSDGGPWIELGRFQILESLLNGMVKNVVRVAPEKKYRPYKDILEVPRDRWVRHKASGVINRICSLDPRTDVTRVRLNGWIGFNDMFQDYEWEDGSPCGVEVRE